MERIPARSNVTLTTHPREFHTRALRQEREGLRAGGCAASYRRAAVQQLAGSSPVFGDGLVGVGELALDVEGRAALVDERRCSERTWARSRSYSLRMANPCVELPNIRPKAWNAVGAAASRSALILSGMPSEPAAGPRCCWRGAGSPCSARHGRECSCRRSASPTCCAAGSREKHSVHDSEAGPCAGSDARDRGRMLARGARSEDRPSAGLAAATGQSTGPAMANSTVQDVRIYDRNHGLRLA